MKTYILFVLLIFSCLQAFSQLNKRNMFAGSSAGFNYMQSNNIASSGDPVSFNISSSMSVTPNFGYFIRDRLAIGIQPRYYGQKQFLKMQVGEETSTEITNREFTLQLFIRKFIMFSKALGFYTSLNAGAGKSIQHAVLKGPDRENIVFRNMSGPQTSLDIDCGLIWFLRKKIGLQAGISGLGWKFQVWENNGARSHVHNVNAGLNMLQLSIGLSYFPGK